MPRRRRTDSKCTLFRLKNPLSFWFLNVSWNEKTKKCKSDLPRNIQAGSSQKPGVKRVTSSGLSFSAQRHCVTCPKIKDFGERYDDLEPQSMEQFNFSPPELSYFFSDKLHTHIQFGFPTSASDASQTTPWGAASTAHSSTWPVGAVFK